MASPLPRECSATELQGQNITGAGERDRTVVVSLEGFCSTIELHPHTLQLLQETRLLLFHGSPESRRFAKRRSPQDFAETLRSPIELHPQCNDFTCSVNQWWRGLDSNQRTRKRADLQSAAINHSATSPRNPTLSGFSVATSNREHQSDVDGQRQNPRRRVCVPFAGNFPSSDAVKYTLVVPVYALVRPIPPHTFNESPCNHRPFLTPAVTGASGCSRHVGF